MTAAPRPAARDQRRGFFWQDSYAAWITLRCIAEPAEGIQTVELEAAGADHVDDVIVHRSTRVEYMQLKHKVSTAAKSTFTGSDLFTSRGKDAKGNAKPPMIAQLFKGWQKVKSSSRPTSVRLITNATASDSARNKPISPLVFARDIVAPARTRTWTPPTHLSGIVDDIMSRAACPSITTFLDFLADLQFTFDAPSEESLRQSIEASLSILRRSATALEAGAWIERVYDISTQHHARPLSKENIEQEVRNVLQVPRIAEHRLALPPHHMPRAFATELLQHAKSLSEGYLVVSGPPGSGKSTLATWFANEHNSDVLVRYHVFDPVHNTPIERSERASAFGFIRTLFDALSQRFPEHAPPIIPSPDNLAASTRQLHDSLSNLAAKTQSRYVLIDGIDHVVRSGLTANRIFDVLPEAAPAGVVFILFGQPDWDYPRWIRTSSELRLPPFSRAEVRQYIFHRFAWHSSQPGSTELADFLYDKSGGNPLSIFYNVQSALREGDDPESILIRRANIKVFGPSPHEEYARLIEDLEAALRFSTRSRSLTREFITFLSAATCAITTSRICTAFGGDLAAHQARDILDTMRPVVVEREPGEFWLFHDDFRRFIETDSTPEQLKSIHARWSRALEHTWHPRELDSCVAHLWAAEFYQSLAELPDSRTVPDWFLSAPTESVLKMHQYALAGAFSLMDPVRIFSNTLLTGAVAEIADSLESAEAAKHRLGDWSFIVPPRGADIAASRTRANALKAAIAGLYDEPDLAHELAQRFSYTEAELHDIAESNEQYHQQFIQEWICWLFFSGQLNSVNVALKTWAKEGQGRALVVKAVVSTMGQEWDASVLSEWCESILGLDHHLDNRVIRLGVHRLAHGHLDIASALSHALFSRCVPEHRGRAAVLKAVIESETGKLPREDLNNIRIPPMVADDPTDLFDIFAHGFMHVQGDGPLNMELCKLPTRISVSIVADRKRPDPYLALARHIWRLGCLGGLLKRNPELVLRQDILHELQPMLSDDHQQFGYLDYLLPRCAGIYLPLIARLIPRCTDLVDNVAVDLVRWLNRPIASISAKTRGILESTWLLAPNTWKEIAHEAVQSILLPGTDAEEREGWFNYWDHFSQERGIQIPADFPTRAIAAQLGTHAKEDIIGLAVDLIVNDHASPDVISRASTILDLLVKLADTAGSSSARDHLPRLLAVVLYHDPAQFYIQYVAATKEFGVAEQFGGVSADVVREWLTLDTPASVDDLVAAWCWMASCPASLDNEVELADAIIDRLVSLKADDDIAMVQRWRPSCDAEANGHADANQEDDDGEFVGGPTVGQDDVKGICFRWLSAWYSGADHRKLRLYLSQGGAHALKVVCTRIAEELTHEPKVFPFEYLQTAYGLLRLFDSLDANSVLDVATEYASRKLLFQPGVSVDRISAAVPMDELERRSAAEVFIDLIVRGIEVSDTETLRRSIRSLGALARRPGTSDVVQSRLRQHINSTDVLLQVCCLVILRECATLTQQTIDVVRALVEHDDAWCRWTASDILGAQPVWPPLRKLSAIPGIIATAETLYTHRDVGAVYYSGETEIAEVYVRKFGRLSNMDEYDLRSYLALEVAALPEVPRRPTGWHRHVGTRLSGMITSDAAARLASRLASKVDVAVVPNLLSVAARFDPWLVLAEPIVDPPHGWVELASGTRTPTTYLLRSLSLVHPNTEVTEEELALGGMVQTLERGDTHEFAWVSDNWQHGMAAPPLDWSTGPVIALSILNKAFTCLRTDQFALVPYWALPFFSNLTYSGRPRPQWVHPRLGPVIVAVKREKPSEDRGGSRTQVEWSNGWYANPDWLRGLTELGWLTYCWRRQQQERGRDEESTVTWGIERLNLD